MLIAKLVLWLSLAGVLYTYVGYPLLLALCHLVYHRRASKPADSFSPSVSIVSAAFNEAKCIRAKLENCLALDYPRANLQILVGSDGSDDGTNQIVAEFRERGIDFFAFAPRRGKMATVNRLVARASGELCVFSDISEVFDPDALRMLTRHFADPEIGAVTGNHVYRSKNTGLGKGTAFYWRFQRFLQTVESRVYSVFACDGTIYACRRELFPYPPDDTINDDVAVPLGIIARGKRVIFEPQAIARGEVLAETGRFFRQKIRRPQASTRSSRFPWMFIPVAAATLVDLRLAFRAAGSGALVSRIRRDRQRHSFLLRRLVLPVAVSPARQFLFLGGHRLDCRQIPLSHPLRRHPLLFCYGKHWIVVRLSCLPQRHAEGLAEGGMRTTRPPGYRLRSAGQVRNRSSFAPAPRPHPRSKE